MLYSYNYTAECLMNIYAHIHVKRLYFVKKKNPKNKKL